jgi:hypothetical protein
MRPMSEPRARRQQRRPGEVAERDPLRPVTFRLPSDVVDAAKKKAAERGETLTAAVADLLRGYAARK